MRYLITGGSGLIGARMAIELSQEGHEVIVLSRFPEKMRDRHPAAIDLVKWDGRTSQGWRGMVEGAEAIINLAGENLSSGRWTQDRKRRILSSRVHAGHAVLEAVSMAQDKPRLVVQASAVGYYGPRDAEQITEQASPGDDFLASVVQQWEASTAPVEAEGVRRLIVRTALVLDRRNPAIQKMTLPFKFFVGGKVGNGNQWFPWIHISDWISAVRMLMGDSEASGAFNLSAPGVVTNAELSRAIGRVLRRPAFIPVPAFAMRILFGEMSTIILEGQQAIPQGLEDMGFKFRFPSIEPALEDILR